LFLQLSDVATADLSKMGDCTKSLISLSDFDRWFALDFDRMVGTVQTAVVHHPPTDGSQHPKTADRPSLMQSIQHPSFGCHMPGRFWLVESNALEMVEFFIFSRTAADGGRSMLMRKGSSVGGVGVKRWNCLSTLAGDTGVRVRLGIGLSLGKCLGCFIRRGMFALCWEIKHHLGRFSFSHGFPFPDMKKTA
jgi:hypothetical protein